MSEEIREMIHPEWKYIQNAHYGFNKMETIHSCLICARKLQSSTERFCSDCTRRYAGKAS